jgi:hypothetical protein
MKLYLRIVIFFASISFGAVETEFVGIPITKISEGGVGRVVDSIDSKNSQQFRCIISKIDGRYYWASRMNKELARIDGGGAYITFIALDGSGTIRVTKPAL